ncbi:MAG: Cof-type HAD-IIB family hydrolase [Bacilli bacterium]
MTYRMIVLDMDDTLLRDDHTMSETTKAALIRAQEEGLKVVLASGRPTFAMRETAKQLKLDQYGSYILSYNGGIITDCRTNEVSYSCMLPAETMHQMYKESQTHGVHIHTYVNEQIVTEKNNPYTEIEGEITGMPIVEVSSFHDAVQVPCVKALIVDAPEKLAEVEPVLKAKYADELNIMRSKPFFLEVIHKDVDKGQSLARLIETLGIQQSEVIACGDSFNDASMIQFAGLGVAMGNAHPEIKAMSDFVTRSNNEDGIVHVLDTYVFATVR